MVSKTLFQMLSPLLLTQLFSMIVSLFRAAAIKLTANLIAAYVILRIGLFLFHPPSILECKMRNQFKILKTGQQRGRSTISALLKRLTVKI